LAGRRCCARRFWPPAAGIPTPEPGPAGAALNRRSPGAAGGAVNVELWLSFDVGRTALLPSKGLGRVTEINRAHDLRVEFADGAMMSFRMGKPQKLLTALEPGHFLLESRAPAGAGRAPSPTRPACWNTSSAAPAAARVRDQGALLRRGAGFQWTSCGRRPPPIRTCRVRAANGPPTPGRSAKKRTRCAPPREGGDASA
jgi:hypothetical protein